MKSGPALAASQGKSAEGINEILTFSKPRVKTFRILPGQVLGLMYSLVDGGPEGASNSYLLIHGTRPGSVLESFNRLIFIYGAGKDQDAIVMGDRIVAVNHRNIVVESILDVFAIHEALSAAVVTLTLIRQQDLETTL